MYKQKDIDFFLSFPTVRLELPSFEIQVTLTAIGALFYDNYYLTLPFGSFVVRT